MTHTTRTFDKMGETTQTVVKTSQESARIFTDYAVKAQELNTQFARRAVETWIDGLRKQTELSQDVAQELFGRAEEQAYAYRRYLRAYEKANKNRQSLIDRFDSKLRAS